MGVGTVILAGLRTLVILDALAIIGLGAWVLHTIHDVEIRGSAILDTLLLNQERRTPWNKFFEAAVSSQIRIWVTIAAGGLVFLFSSFIMLSTKMARLSVPRPLLVSLEIVSFLVMGAAFGVVMSLTIEIRSPCINLETSSSADLVGFQSICPASIGYSIASGVGCLLLSITALWALVSICQRVRKNNSQLSFEPTASALGMGHSYQAVQPQLTRATIPTLYDPRKPIPGTPVRPPREDEIGYKKNPPTEEKRRDSGLSERSGYTGSTYSENEREITGPLDLERPEKAKQIRPTRPWSEMPRQK